MKRLFDLKAIGYGVAAFVVAQLLISQVMSRLITPEMFRWMVEHAAWISWVNETFVPGIAGFVAAWTARFHRIINGVIGGLLPVVLVVIFYIPFIKVFLSWGVPFLAVVFYGLMAFLGAALANYWRGKRGA